MCSEGNERKLTVRGGFSFRETRQYETPKGRSDRKTYTTRRPTSRGTQS